jgi:hypothetical protein
MSECFPEGYFSNPVDGDAEYEAKKDHDACPGDGCECACHAELTPTERYRLRTYIL